MRRWFVFCSVVVVMVSSCKSSQTAVTPQQLEGFSQLVDSKAFRIESEWAHPQLTSAFSQRLVSQLLLPGNTASAINLVGNPNFLTINGDSIASYLPYFGQRQLRVAYGGTDGSISLKGPMQDYTVKTNKDESRTITFTADSNTEAIDVIIRVFPNLKADISINSATRQPIQYSGRLQTLEAYTKS